MIPTFTMPMFTARDRTSTGTVATRTRLPVPRAAPRLTIRHVGWLGLLSGLFVTPAEAGVSLDPARLTAPGAQADFASIATDVAVASAHRSLQSAAWTGVGVGVGVVADYAPTADRGAWERLTGDRVAGVPVVGLTAHKGLPLKLDVAASITSIPGTSARVFGGEVRYAILPGDALTPALALRASYTRLAGLDDFRQQSTGASLLASKGVGPITAYGGWSLLVANTTPTGNAAPFLTRTRTNANGPLLGLRLSGGLVDATAETGRLNSRSIYSLRLGLAF